MPLIHGRFTSLVSGCRRGTLLIDYLEQRFPYQNREQWLARLEAGLLTLDEEIAQSNTPIRSGMSLCFRVENYDEPEVPLDWKVLIEPSRSPLMFIHKPAGLPVTRTGKIFFNTLANLVKNSLGQDWSPLHRLDRETSGIVAFAQGPEAFRVMAPESQHSQWTKIYFAVIRGHLPTSQGSIHQPLGEILGDPIRSRMQVTPLGKPALTLWQVIQNVGPHSLVALSPITGRKHQLRAHLAALACPILGDILYQFEGRYYLQRLERDLNDSEFATLGARHHLLHAAYLHVAIGDRQPLPKKGREAFRFESISGLNLEHWDLEFPHPMASIDTNKALWNFVNSSLCTEFLQRIREQQVNPALGR